MARLFPAWVSGWKLAGGWLGDPGPATQALQPCALILQGSLVPSHAATVRPVWGQKPAPCPSMDPNPRALRKALRSSEAGPLGGPENEPGSLPPSEKSLFVLIPVGIDHLLCDKIQVIPGIEKAEFNYTSLPPSLGERTQIPRGLLLAVLGSWMGIPTPTSRSPSGSSWGHRGQEAS